MLAFSVASAQRRTAGPSGRVLGAELRGLPGQAFARRQLARIADNPVYAGPRQNLAIGARRPPRLPLSRGPIENLPWFDLEGELHMEGALAYPVPGHEAESVLGASMAKIDPISTRLAGKTWMKEKTPWVIGWPAYYQEPGTPAPHPGDRTCDH